MLRWLAFITNAFPLWVLLGGVTALLQPGWFAWFSAGWIVWGLTLVMLGMGITLSVQDFQRVGRMPRAVAIGLVAQYMIMPLTAWGIANLFALPQPFAVGLILVGCCPGGTASNVITYLAQGNVALSVLMTMCSTLVAIIMTPLLTAWLAGEWVSVDGVGIFFTTLKVILLPVVIGLILHHAWPKLVAFVQPVSPLISIVVITLICAGIISHNSAAIFEYGKELLGAVALLHSVGFALGWGFARGLGYGPQIARTISIETGMQNSGLATVLARTHFTAEPLVAVPSAVSSICHSVIGSLVAGKWRLSDRAQPPQSGQTLT